ncbi:MAG: N-methyl-L-tryptophan oxidase [Ardenticatenaceae bacterium]|nr:N-methyl-L-tryptophan oxidase [Ardenticatenaceae bacterium]
MVGYSKRFNVIVAGVGGMGSATCYHLAKRGQRVLGLEKHDIPHDLGSSHGYTRIIRLAYYEHPSYVMLLKRAYELWEEIEQLTGEKIFYRTGSIDAGPADSWVFKGSFQSVIEHGIDHEVLTGIELAKRFPGYQLPFDHMALYQKDGGFIVPERATINFVEAAHHYGAEIHGREEVLAYQPTPEGGVKVFTNRSEYEADRLVITAGAWNADLVPMLNGLATPERQALAWFQPERPEQFQLDNFPVFNLLVEEGRYYGFPIYGVPGFKIGLYHHFKEHGVPESFNWDADLVDEDALREAVDRYFPMASGPTMSLKVCMFTNSPDGHFVIGHVPDMDQVTFAAGFTGHGYKFASVMGEVMADLAERGYTRHDISLFDPERFTGSWQSMLEKEPFRRHKFSAEERILLRRDRLLREHGMPGGRRRASIPQQRLRQRRPRLTGRRGRGPQNRPLNQRSHRADRGYEDTTSPWYWKDGDVETFW